MSAGNDVTVVYVDPDNISNDLRGAVMRGLLDQGYTIGPAMLWQSERDSAPKLALLMVPPSPTPAARPAGPLWLSLASQGAMLVTAAVLLAKAMLG